MDVDGADLKTLEFANIIHRIKSDVGPELNKDLYVRPG